MIDTSALNFQYAYIYVAINLFCAFFSLLLLSNFSFQVGNSRETALFHLMNGTFLIYLLLEIIWILSYTEYIPLPPLATGLIKILDTMLIPLVVYLWFWLMEDRFHSRLVASRLFHVVFSIPLIAMFLLYVTSFFTGLVFKVTDQLTIEPGPLFYLTGVVDNFYGAAIAIHSTILYARERSSYNRHHYWSHIIFIGICTTTGIFDAIYKTTPVMTLAISFALVYIFMNLIEPHIYSAYNDALTGLYNRRHADRYLLDTIGETTEENPFYLFMLDVDRFKEINDTLGHLEGDRALKVVATAIHSVTSEYRGFAARWGGDEFVVLIKHEKEGTFPDFFAKAIEEKIKHHANQNFIKYPLDMSIGHAICDSTADTIAGIIEIADKMLYRNKMEKHSDSKLPISPLQHK